MNHFRQKVRAPLTEATYQEQRILHFSLDPILPEKHQFALHTDFGILTLLTVDSTDTPVQEMQQFTTSELAILLPLFELYPDYCPYEVLLASFFDGRVTDHSVEKYRRQLHDAHETSDYWDMLLNPIRKYMTRIRTKMHVFQLDFEIVSLSETGYILLPEKQKSYLHCVVPNKTHA